MAAASRWPTWAWVVIVGVGLILVCAVVLGLVVALALPSLSQARISANEAGAIGAVRSVSSAQAVAAAVNGGFFLPLECLGAPSSCIPDYTGAPFLPEIRAGGYSARFVPGQSATQAERQESLAKAERSLRSFAFLMVPERPGETGRRSFCVDAGGEICFTEGGAPPDTAGGRCSACTPLR